MFTDHRFEGMAVGVCLPFMDWSQLVDRRSSGAARRRGFNAGSTCKVAFSWGSARSLPRCCPAHGTAPAVNRDHLITIAYDAESGTGLAGSDPARKPHQQVLIRPADQAPWHFLNFFSLPRAKGSLRPTSFRALRTGSWWPVVAVQAVYMAMIVVVVCDPWSWLQSGP